MASSSSEALVNSLADNEKELREKEKEKLGIQKLGKKKKSLGEKKKTARVLRTGTLSSKI